MNTSFDIGISNPFEKFNVSIVCSLSGGWFFGVGLNLAKIKQAYEKEGEYFKNGFLSTKKDLADWKGYLKDTQNTLKRKLDEDTANRNKAGVAYGGSVDLTVGLAGTGAWVPNPVSGYYCDMGFEIYVSFTMSGSISIRFMVGPVPLMGRISASFNFGMAFRVGWMFAAGVSP